MGRGALAVVGGDGSISQAARVAIGASRAIDVGAVDDIPFVNAAGFGFDVHVLERMREQTLFRVTAACVGTALRALFAYRGIDARIDGRSDSTQLLMLVVANGQYFGGAFRIAPLASVTDGLLDMVAIAGMPPLRRLSLFVRAMRGQQVTIRVLPGALRLVA